MLVDSQLVGSEGIHPKDMSHRRQTLSPSHAFDGTIFACKAEIVFSDPPSLWGSTVHGFIIENKYSVDLDELSDWVPAEEKLRTILLPY